MIDSQDTEAVRRHIETSYILVPGTRRTVGEYVVTAGGVPNMNPQLSDGGVS